MRWVLIRPANRSPYYDPEIQEPLGLEYLAASRASAGDAVLLLDSVLDGYNDSRLARRAVSFQPHAIGFSITTAQELHSVQAIHAEVCRVLPPRPIHWLAGGNFITSEPLQAQKLLPPGFIAVRFEGETVLAELAKQWDQGFGPDHFDAPVSVLNGKAILDLDTLPYPHRPYAPQILASNWAFSLQGSRGCCGACRYCSSPGMSEPSARRWRGRSAAHIVDEIQLLHTNLGATSFVFVDEDFLGPAPQALSRAHKFASAIRKRALPIHFSIQVRPATLDESVIRCLAEVGLIYVFMGIESDDEADFRFWGRPFCAHAWKTATCLKKYGVELNCGVLLFHTRSTFPKIRRFASTLHQYRLLNYRSAINRLDAMPGSAMYREAEANGDIVPEIPGPQQLPFEYPGVADFYRDLLIALGPVGPPSMHAICALLPLLARQRSKKPLAATATDLAQLRRIIHDLDHAVARTLFNLLDYYEMGSGEAGLAMKLFHENLDIAHQGCVDLAALGFASSFEQLWEAVKLDSRM